VKTLTDVLLHNARTRADAVAVLDHELSLTWSEFTRRIARLGGVLNQSGINRGDRFGILALNSWRQAEVIHAGQWIGATPVPINFRLAPAEIRTTIDDAECELLVVDEQFIGLLDGPELADWKSRHLLISGNKTGFYERAVKSGKPMEPATGSADTEALLLFTGGTSGRAKGVPLTHGNIIANAKQVGSRWSAQPDDVVLHVPPMFHSAELVKTVYFMQGAASVYLPKFDPDALLRTIEEFHVTFALLVPTMLMLTLQSGKAHQYDTSSLKQIIYGASPMSVEWVREAFAAFPEVEFAQGYGLTETAPLLTMLDYRSHLGALRQDNAVRLSSCGRVLEGVELKIMDSNGRDCATGQVGEICARGDNVFSGYINQDELTNEVLADGCFRTGDLGYLDDEGYLYLKDRKQDMIVTGGENVYSGEVEAVLNRHPEVLEVAVIGIPDEIYGEKVIGLATAKTGSNPTQAELIGFCKDKIGGYKIPKEIHIVDSLPKSALGKVLKTELRSKYK
jgi:long-chain acyl-CoA synthetase